jgi:hypothetical protein
MALLATCSMLDSCMAYSSNLKMEATCSFETSVDFQWTTRRYIPEDRTLCDHRRENLKSYTYNVGSITTYTMYRYLDAVDICNN